MKILNEIIKNIKIIVRNWTSLSLLIIGPLALILLIGFAFSGDELHDINLGLVTNDRSISEVINFTQGDISFYDNAEDCIKNVKTKKEHMCIEFSDDFIKTTDESIIPTGNMKFYYDPSEKALSSALIEGVQDSLGLKAKELSISTVETIFGKIQVFVVFLVDSRGDIDDAISEAEGIRSELIQRRAVLINISNNFNPTYEKIKQLQSVLENSTLDESSDELMYDISTLRKELDNITLSETNDSLLNMSYLTLSLGNFSRSLSNFENSMNDTLQDITETKTTIALSISQIDAIKDYLDDEINATENSIIRINEGIEKMKEVGKVLDKNLDEMSRLKPEISKDLINPISSKTEPLLEMSNTSLLFPTILVTIMIFITMLFSNIVTLSEIHSKAYFRGFIVPARRSIFVIGVFLTAMIILLFQISILFLVAQTSFGVDVLKNIGDVLFLTAIVIALFSLIGMAIAYLFRNQQTSILITTFSTLIFFLMSNAVIPLEIMPKEAFLVASYNPFYLAQKAFSKILLFGSYTYINEAIVLASYTLALTLIVGIIIYKERSRN